MTEAKNEERNDSMKALSKVTLAAAALALLGVSALSTKSDDGRHSDARWKTLVIDVAEDMRTLSANTASPTDTEPKRGTTAIINGKIYPGGTIPAGDGLDIDTLTGSIGNWITRHTLNFDASQIAAGAHPALSSTEYYLFTRTGVSDGEEALFSEGPEFGATTHRVVLGGTGRYRGVIGEVQEETLGANSTGFANKRFTFTIRSPE